ncbi:hypothetical protein GCM10017668_03270 [Streptomyces tuirus]|uniref:Uncharacterized protein n=1 Tax=Streptomyces tuirus TaxID=68278 RepID=A0A7G1NAB7_9ACTN|nr:hypothetical protein GCM10017668_03270 [Streptomyces tuirus]
MAGSERPAGYASYVPCGPAAGCVLVCPTWCVPVATVVSADGWADPLGSLGMAGSFGRGDEEQVVILASREECGRSCAPRRVTSDVTLTITRRPRHPVPLG